MFDSELCGDKCTEFSSLLLNRSSSLWLVRRLLTVYSKAGTSAAGGKVRFHFPDTNQMLLLATGTWQRLWASLESVLCTPKSCYYPSHCFYMAIFLSCTRGGCGTFLHWLLVFGPQETLLTWHNIKTVRHYPAFNICPFTKPFLR